MDKENLAYKLTSDILKKYDLSVLEEKYQKFGGALVSTIFNEIYTGLNMGTESPVIFCVEDELLD